MWLPEYVWRQMRAVTSAACLAVGLAVAPLGAEMDTGDPLPNWSDYGVEGDLPDLTGKVVLLDVWASWCAPCKASFPSLSALQKELGPSGLEIVGLGIDRKKSGYERFLKRLAPAFTTVWDSEQKLVGELEPPAMPTSFLFGRDGRLHAIHVGFHGESTVTELRAQILKLLEQTSP
jgi:thiol-disulfide isomerase/thioredoxin